MSRIPETLALIGCTVTLLAAGCSSSPATTSTTTGGSSTGAFLTTGGGTTTASSTSAGTATGTGTDTGTGTGTDTGGLTGTDSGTGTTSGGSTGGPPPFCFNGSDAGTLYDCYGGAPTIQGVVNTAETNLLSDCVTSPYFAGLDSAGFDSTEKLTGCLNLFFAAAMSSIAAPDNVNPPVALYPGVNEPEYDSTGAPILGFVSRDVANGPWTFGGQAGTLENFSCASMRNAHSNFAANPDLGIVPEVFDEFVLDVGAALVADAGFNTSTSDYRAVRNALNGLKGEVVSYYPQQYFNCNMDAGYPRGTSTWTRTGGGPTIANVVQGMQAALSTDCVTSPYFDLVDAGTGYETWDKMNACTMLFLATYIQGGPGQYPSTHVVEYDDAGNPFFGLITTGNTLDGGHVGFYLNAANTSLNPNIPTTAYQCANLLFAHGGDGGLPNVGATSMAFSEYLVDLGYAMTDAGFTSADFTTVNNGLSGEFNEVVAECNNEWTYSVCATDGGYDGGLPDSGILGEDGGACVP